MKLFASYIRDLCESKQAGQISIRKLKTTLKQIHSNILNCCQPESEHLLAVATTE